MSERTRASRSRKPAPPPEDERSDDLSEELSDASSDSSSRPRRQSSRNTRSSNPTRRSPVVKATSTVTTSSGKSKSVLKELDQTEGIYSHYAPNKANRQGTPAKQGVDSDEESSGDDGEGRGKPLASAAAAPPKKPNLFPPLVGGVPVPGSNPPDTTDDEEVEIENQIGVLVGPGYDGLLHAGGLEEDELETRAGTSLEIDKLRKLLRNWFTDEKREDLLSRIRNAVVESKLKDGLGDKEAETSRKEALTLLYENLRKSIEDTNRKFGRTWIEGIVKRQQIIDLDPRYLFSVNVQNHTDINFANYIYQKATEHYFPFIQSAIEEESRRIRQAKVDADSLKELYEAERRRITDFLKMRDILVMKSFPPTGLDTAGELLELLEMYLPKVDVASLRASTEPGEIQQYQGLLDYVKQRKGYLPQNSILTALTGSSASPWTEPAGRPFHEELNEVDQLAKFKENLGGRLKALGIAPTSRLDSQLTLAFDLLTKGITNTLALGATELRRPREHIELSLTGDLWNALKGDLGSNMRISSNTLVVDFFVPENVLAQQVYDKAAVRKLLTQPKVAEFAVSLAPYTPAAVVSLPGASELIQFKTTVIDGDPPTRNILSSFYKHVDNVLLNYQTGLWKKILLNVNWDAETTEAETKTATYYSVRSYFESIIPDEEQFEHRAEGRKKFVEFFKMIQSGTSLTQLVNFLTDDKDGNWGLMFDLWGHEGRKRPGWILEKLRTVVKKMDKALETDPKTMDTEEIPNFPIQYHIDARFTILYVLLQYEFIREVIELVAEFCRETITVAIDKTKKQWDVAQARADTLEKNKEATVEGLGFLRWSLLPENTGIVTLDPRLSGAVTEAWSWISMHARSVPWDRPEVREQISADAVINDMSDDYDALQVKTFLVRVTAMILSQKKAHNTTSTSNSSSAQQLVAGGINESLLKGECIRLRLVTKSGVGKDGQRREKLMLAFSPDNRWI